jgi:hypothetical protein
MLLVHLVEVPADVARRHGVVTIQHVRAASRADAEAYVRQCLSNGTARMTLEPRPLAGRFSLVRRGDGVGIRCHTCGLTSYHPEDVRSRYCGHCHVFHEERAGPGGAIADL